MITPDLFRTALPNFLDKVGGSWRANSSSLFPKRESLVLSGEFARSFYQALMPFALSSRIWRYGGSVTSSALFSQGGGTALSRAVRLAKVSRGKGAHINSFARACALHSRIVSATGSDSVPGAIRKSTLRHFDSGLAPAAPENIKRLIRISGLNEILCSESPQLCDAFWTALAVIAIHPFQDANGRLARALCSLIATRVLSDRHVPMPISFLMQGGGLLYRKILPHAVSTCSSQTLMSFVSRASSSWVRLTESMSEASSRYEEKIFSDFPGRNLDGYLGLAIFSVSMSDSAYKRCISRLEERERRALALYYFECITPDGRIIWLNRRLCGLLDSSMKHVYVML